jgi:hypothetical protein
MRRFARENSLSLVCGLAFLLSVVGQVLAGQRAFNEDQLAHGGETVSLARYLVSSESLALSVRAQKENELRKPHLAQLSRF